MASSTREIDDVESSSCLVKSPDDSTPLLGCESQSVGYATCPDNHIPRKGGWEPADGFWWIETALWANVFLSGFDGTITASTYAAISSDFDAANNASWMTTSYLITSTAFQPLYGRLSDMFGRRVCFFVSTITFAVGCLGCSIATTMLQLNLMRALTGFGGGGLITMATIINSDMIPFEQRGLYQAMQNVLYGFGTVLGASAGGLIVDGIGWRWCFLLQVPVSIFALIVGYRVLVNPEPSTESSPQLVSRRVDFVGALLLVVALVAQLMGLSLGGNEYAWDSKLVIGSLAWSVVLLAGFLLVEANTKAVPIVPLWVFHGWQPIAVQLTNVFVGMSSYAYMFMVPLYFQAVRGDSASAAGLRLMVPSMATLIGGIVAGVMMQRGFPLRHNVRNGTALILLGNILACMMGTAKSEWMEFGYLIPANLGVGLTNPSVLFSFVSLFERKEQAVTTSTVYLVRSMGSIYGVTVTSAIVQNLLAARLPETLGSDASEELIEKLRKSIFALKDLPPATEMAVRALYGDALRLAFVASSGCALLAFVISWGHKTESMLRKA